MKVQNTREQSQLAKEQGKALFVAGFDMKAGKLMMSGLMDHRLADATAVVLVLAYREEIPVEELNALYEKYKPKKARGES